jgi:hypothetical protein
MTANIFEIVVGRGTLKWDAVWRTLAWFATPTEGHGLGASFRDRLATYCFGTQPEAVTVSVEFYLGRDSQSKSRHPDLVIGAPDLHQPNLLALFDDIGVRSPGGRRKIENLMAYSKLAAERYPACKRYNVAVTDSLDFGRFSAVSKAFSEAREPFSLLPLQMIGAWLEQIPAKKLQVVQDFQTWTQEL